MYKLIATGGGPAVIDPMGQMLFCTHKSIELAKRPIERWVAFFVLNANELLKIKRKS